MAKTLKVDELFAYADRFARRCEAAGKGTSYPTVRRCARRFRTTIAAIIEIADEPIDDAYVGLSYYYVAWKVPDGDYFVEAYR